jgi:hypothetical protein
MNQRMNLNGTMPVQSKGFSFVKDHPNSSDHKSMQAQLLAQDCESLPNGTECKTGLNDTINLEAYHAYYNTNENNVNKSMPNEAFQKSSTSKANFEVRNSCDQNYPSNSLNHGGVLESSPQVGERRTT